MERFCYLLALFRLNLVTKPVGTETADDVLRGMVSNLIGMNSDEVAGTTPSAEVSGAQ